MGPQYQPVQAQQRRTTAIRHRKVDRLQVGVLTRGARIRYCLKHNDRVGSVQEVSVNSPDWPKAKCSRIASMSKETRATQALSAAGINFTVYHYAYNPDAYHIGAGRRSAAP
jgi:hypothetical protein